MITVANYNQQITPEIIKTLPGPLKAGHEYLVEAGDFYNEDKEIKETIDLYVNKLNKYMAAGQAKTTPSKKQVPKEKKPQNVKKKVQSKKPKKTATKIETVNINYIFSESKDFYFVKRFVNMHDKVKSRHQIGLYIKALQRAIIGKEIRKTSKYASHITKIQQKLCEQYNKMKDTGSVTIAIENKWLEALKTIVNKEKVYKSVMIIKRYISLEGKAAPDKVNTLLKAINNAIKKKQITKSDPYYDMIDKIRKNLKQSVEGSTVKIEKAELAGLLGIVDQFEEQEMNGLDCICEGPISSVDFARLKFKTLGFKGKWKDFIGDPTPGFTALVYGKPKSGKSTLCAMMAGYLAANHGRVLYVSKEEGKNGILQERFIRVGAMHPNLEIDDDIPYDKIRDYDFLILDSVHKLGLDEETLDQFPKKYPHIKGFLFIMHSTKGGNFRGSQTYAHNVDVLIHVEDGGTAHQSGRFAQGSEFAIFDNQ